MCFGWKKWYQLAANQFKVGPQPFAVFFLILRLWDCGGRFWVHSESNWPWMKVVAGLRPLRAGIWALPLLGRRQSPVAAANHAMYVAWSYSWAPHSHIELKKHPRSQGDTWAFLRTPSHETHAQPLRAELCCLMPLLQPISLKVKGRVYKARILHGCRQHGTDLFPLIFKQRPADSKPLGPKSPTHHWQISSHFLGINL